MLTAPSCSRMPPKKWLCVAEKPSISKSITQILSGGQFQTVRVPFGLFVRT